MLHIQKASELIDANDEALLPSLNEELNRVFERQALRWRGGFPKGSVIEWGIPYGIEGRSIPVQFLAHVTRNEQRYALWVEQERDKNSLKSKMQIYPPRFAAEGVLLNKLLFVSAEKPISELKPVFLEPLFQLIILNDPQYCTSEDMMFLSLKARQLSCVIFVLRPFHLHPEKGNIWAKYRINVLDDHRIDFIKGGQAPKQIRFLTRREERERRDSTERYGEERPTEQQRQKPDLSRGHVSNSLH